MLKVLVQGVGSALLQPRVEHLEQKSNFEVLKAYILEDGQGEVV